MRRKEAAEMNTNIMIVALAYTRDELLEGMRQLINENRSNIKTYRLSYNGSPFIIFNDGTVIEGRSFSSHFIGRQYDQMLLFDDDRWNIEVDRWKEINKIEEQSMYASCVPDEFKILRFEM